MLLVDEILEINDQEVVCSFEIKEDNIFLENGVFAETGLIENAAQTCSAIVAKSYFVDQDNKEKEHVKVIGFISGIKKLKVHGLPETGNQITTKALLSSRFDAGDYRICTMLCTTYREEELLFEAEINLFIQEVQS